MQPGHWKASPWTASWHTTQYRGAAPSLARLGWDALHPRALLRLPDGLLRWLVAILTVAERTGEWSRLRTTAPTALVEDMAAALGRGLQLWADVSRRISSNFHRNSEDAGAEGTGGDSMDDASADQTTKSLSPLDLKAAPPSTDECPICMAPQLCLR